jgi:hypothetical protein
MKITIELCRSDEDKPITVTYRRKDSKILAANMILAQLTEVLVAATYGYKFFSQPVNSMVVYSFDERVWNNPHGYVGAVNFNRDLHKRIFERDNESLAVEKLADYLECPQILIVYKRILELVKTEQLVFEESLHG